MKRNNSPLMALLVLLIATLACSLPSGTSEPPATTDDVATIVAATLQALTPSAPAGGGAPTAAPVGLLPHPLYFLNNDSLGITQVYRLETDGKTLRQVTFEPAAVNSYDVSQVDGSVVYVSNNQLLLIHTDGSGRRVLVDPGPVDPNNQFTDGTNSPIFSPDGQTVAYSSGGLILYSISRDAGNVVLEKKVQDSNTGIFRPAEVYIPQNYSPDGTKILLTVAIPNSDGISSGIYYINTNTLVMLTGGDGVRVCCSEQAWTSDSSSLYVGIPFAGMFGPGLWRADAASGNLTTLLPSDAGGGNFNLANQPYLAPDGQLYFFYTAATMGAEGFIDNAPLQMVRSATDGVTGRTVLRPETFPSLNEALWAPDGSFVITATAPAQGVYQGGIVELYYTDSQKSMIQLSQFGSMLKWGP